MTALIYVTSPLNKAGPLFRISICQANNPLSRFYRPYHTTDEGRRPAATKVTMEEATNYKEWSNESLIKRVMELERELKGRNAR